MFDYELEIKIKHKEELLPHIAPETGEWWGEDEYRYNDQYYGFEVKDVGATVTNNHGFTDRVFTMNGKSTLKELQKQFMDLTKEILDSDMPSQCFKGAVALLNTILTEQKDQNFDDNLEWEVSRHYPTFGVRMYLHKVPAPVKTPEPDGAVTGSLWKVLLVLQNKDTGDLLHPYAAAGGTVFCIKPESAVHSVLNHLFDKYPNILDQYKIQTPVCVERVTKPFSVPYLITSGEDSETN